MIRVKICGITRPEDAQVAAAAGADAIGLVFAESPRRITADQAVNILAALPPFVTAVALFVNETAERIRALCHELGLRTVQLHGDEPPELAAELADFCVLKAFRIASGADLEAAEGYPADAYLLDSRVPGRQGGTGTAFDWTLLRGITWDRPIILAGGLTPENVADGIRQVQPYGVDTSSGVERAPGIKDPGRVRAFVAQARQALGGERPRRRSPGA
jgi:phosphoribosylanthranilate isomerase